MAVGSSVEAEFRAVIYGIFDVLWIKRLMKDLRVSFSFPIKVYYDNKIAITIAHNPVLLYRMKHVKIDTHFIKEKLEKGLICMPYIPTIELITDILTKGLHKKHFDNLIGKLLVSMSAICSMVGIYKFIIL